MKSLVVLLIACAIALSQAGTLNRKKRGYLSRTGFCLKPTDNYYLADTRLNFYGRAIYSDKPTVCTESDCVDDSHCDGDMKCCKNHCDAMVCTPAERPIDACKGFKCPAGEVCHLQKVECVMPDCPSLKAMNRPACMPAKGLPKGVNPKTLGNHLPDTAAQLLQADAIKTAAADQDDTAAASDETEAAPADAAAAYQNDAFQGSQTLPDGVPQGTDQTLSYTDQSQAPQPFNTQAAPMDPTTTGMSAVPFSDPNGASAPPMDAASFGPAPFDNTGTNPVPQQTMQYAPDQPQDAQSAGLMPLTQKKRDLLSKRKQSVISKKKRSLSKKKRSVH